VSDFNSSTTLTDQGVCGVDALSETSLFPFYNHGEY
jgi:hypothetical protein